MPRSSGNEQKHESGNPAQRWLINRFHGEVIRLLSSAPRDAVLDLGCGEGFVIGHLAEADLTTDQVIVSVPNEPFFRGLNLLRMKNVKRLGSDPEHVQHWSSSAFERLVSNRFEIVDRGRAFPWTLLLLEPRPATDG